jgi:hypothetical protein
MAAAVAAEMVAVAVAAEAAEVSAGAEILIRRKCSNA